MMPASSEKDGGVGVYANEEEGVPQEPPAGGRPLDAQVGAEAPPSSKESSTGNNVVATQQKKADIGVGAVEKDAPLPQGQSAPPQRPVVGEAHGENTPADKNTVVNTPKVNTPHAHATDHVTSSSKVSNPRQAQRVDGLLRSAPSSRSMNDGKLTAHTPKPQTPETNFPMKLYDMLANPDNHHAISWMPHGRAWKVRQKDVFMHTICPQYFSQTKFESFIRQANGWGFRRIRKEGPDRNAYYHELFLRGKPELLEAMRRPLPGEKASQEVMDPNFYAMPVMPTTAPFGLDQKQVSFASPSNTGSETKKRKKDSDGVRSSPESAFSNPYGGQHGHGPDPRWNGMPPPPPSPWGAPPYAYSPYSQPPNFGGYGMPPPPPPPPDSVPPPPPPGWPHQPPHQPSPSGHDPGAHMPSPNGMPPFDPNFYFPPYFPSYHPPPPPPSQMNQPPPSQMNQVSSQYQADGRANDESNMNRPPGPPDPQTMPPPNFGYQYPPYHPPPPPQFPGDMPYYPPPGDMPYIPPVPPAEAGPTSINPGSSSESHSYYPFGSVPPNAAPYNPFPQGNGSGHSDLNLERKDSFQFSPIQHEDES
uniref:HSF-type DNA-binding domain-containing protein n=1 Tax=Skeletonema marinoi TaxID=267567 RepID=A0A7S2KUW7_9STRA|mmetsp:Transcript_17239/g.29125  ORF Transcript_17239/g.29125 Transcript_17239/m.29125 type:complete len:587 (+) Transcript_17239:80-1840(+)